MSNDGVMLQAPRLNLYPISWALPVGLLVLQTLAASCWLVPPPACSHECLSSSMCQLSTGLPWFHTMAIAVDGLQCMALKQLEKGHSLVPPDLTGFGIFMRRRQAATSFSITLRVRVLLGPCEHINAREEHAESSASCTTTLLRRSKIAKARRSLTVPCRILV